MGTEHMQELARIYWTRLGLRLAYTAAMLWLAASVMLSLLPKSTVAAGAGLSSAGDIFRAKPLALIQKKMLPGFDAEDSSSKPMSVLGSKENSDLALAFPVAGESDGLMALRLPIGQDPSFAAQSRRDTLNVLDSDVSYNKQFTGMSVGA